MKSNISFEQLQKEISEAEKYLNEDMSRWVTTTGVGMMCIIYFWVTCKAGGEILRRSREVAEQPQQPPPVKQ